VNTTGIRTDANCAIPNHFSATQSNTSLVTISAASVDGCSLTATIDPENIDEPYGVLNVPSCGVNISNPAFQSVRRLPLSPVG
jgi:hypothetical protein